MDDSLYDDTGMADLAGIRRRMLGPGLTAGDMDYLCAVLKYMEIMRRSPEIFVPIPQGRSNGKDNGGI